MAIVDSDILIRLSGGATNTDPNNSIGGIMSTVGGGIIIDDTLNNDMDDITSSEASSGITIYHGYFYENSHASLTYISPKFYIQSQTSSGDTSLNIGIAPEAKNTAIEVVASETTAPVSVTFTAPANFAAGIALGSLDFGDEQGFWVEYIVNSSAAAVVDAYTLGIQGDTDP